MSTRTISAHKTLKEKKTFRTAFMNSNTLLNWEMKLKSNNNPLKKVKLFKTNTKHNSGNQYTKELIKR